MSRLWRDEEGAAVGSGESPLSAVPPSPLWRDNEGRPDSEVGPGNEGSDLWRVNEGPLASPPRFERRASAAPGEWNQRRTRWAPPDPMIGAPRMEVFAAEARESKGASWVRIGALTALILIVLLAADGVYAGLKLKSALEDSASQLGRGLQLFQEGEIATARLELQGAMEYADQAKRLTRHPSVALASLLPIVGRDSKAAVAVVEAGREVAVAGLAATEAAAVLGLDERGLATTIFRDGRVSLDRVTAAAPYVVQTADALERASGFLVAAPPAHLSVIRTAVRNARERVDEALQTARKGRALFTALPGMLGADSARRYLLVLQTPSEARATGGVAGLFGILNASDGALELGKIEPYAELFGPNPRPVDAPAWFSASYGPQGALSEWPQANVSPNFPIVADVMTQMYEAETGRVVDGVLAMDPVALSALMRGTGSLKVQAGASVDPVVVSPDNVVELLLHDSYLNFQTEDEQNAFLAAIVGGFWSRVQHGEIDTHGLGEGIAEAVDSQHFKMSVDSATGEEALAELGLNGAYPGTGAQTQMVFNNNYGINKVDYFLQRTIDSVVKLDTNGVAHVRTSVELQNRSPDGPRSLLLGLSGNGTPVGTNRMMLSFLLPEGGVVTSLKVGGIERAPLFYTDVSHPVAWFVTDIPAGSSEVATLTYDIDAAVSIAGLATDFVFAFVPQATANPDEISITVVPPLGYSFGDVVGADIQPDGRATRSQPFDETISISASLEPT